MPDISMCAGNSCPIKKRCYRFVAIPLTIRTKSGIRKYWQTYMDFTFDIKKKSCRAFWVASKAQKKEKKEWLEKIKLEEADKNRRR